MVTVPFLVTDQIINQPILGYNVIEYLVLKASGFDRNVLKACFSTDTGVFKKIHYMQFPFKFY